MLDLDLGWLGSITHSKLILKICHPESCRKTVVVEKWLVGTTFLLQNNYAQKDAEKVAKVKEIFAELNIRQVFLDYEEQSYTELLDLINKHSGQLPKEMFVKFAQKIYKRQK